MRYFLTGATGFIGGRIARQLRTAGHRVVTIARDPARAADLVAADVEVHQGDITDPASLRAPMRGADGVFHVAAWYKVGARDKSPAERINVAGTRNVLEAMRDLAIPKGVYTSTLAVFSDTRGHLPDESYHFRGEHVSEYDRTKWLAHYEVALPMIAAGLPLVIVMPGVVYGPGDTSSVRTTFVNYLRRRLPVLPAGAEYCWAHVDDVARAHILAMERGVPGESYIIAGECRSLADVMHLAERITGVPAPRLRPSPRVVRSLAAVAAVLEKVVALPQSYSSEGLRAVAGVTYLGNNAKARRVLGYDPRPLETGLRETLAHEMRLLGTDTPA